MGGTWSRTQDSPNSVEWLAHIRPTWSQYLFLIGLRPVCAWILSDPGEFLLFMEQVPD